MVLAEADGKDTRSIELPACLLDVSIDLRKHSPWFRTKYGVSLFCLGSKSTCDRAKMNADENTFEHHRSPLEEIVPLHGSDVVGNTDEVQVVAGAKYLTHSKMWIGFADSSGSEDEVQLTHIAALRKAQAVSADRAKHVREAKAAAAKLLRSQKASTKRTRATATNTQRRQKREAAAEARIELQREARTLNAVKERTVKETRGLGTLTKQLGVLEARIGKMEQQEAEVRRMVREFNKTEAARLAAAREKTQELAAAVAAKKTLLAANNVKAAERRQQEEVFSAKKVASSSSPRTYSRL